MPWETLRQVRDFNREEAARERDRVPTTCPIDGANLVERGDGARACPLGNWIWRGGVGFALEP